MKFKILIVIDHFPISPRLEKYAKSLKKIYPNVEMKILAWNRNLAKNEKEYIHTIDCKLGYGNKIFKFMGLIRFRNEIEKYIKDFQPDYVHAIDIENMILCSKLKNKYKYELIYEIYDMKFLNNKMLEYIKKYYEKICLKNVSSIIYASPYFCEFYKKYNIKSIVLNNKPPKSIIKNININKNNKNFIVAFVGTVRYFKILKNLMCAISNEKDIILDIYGDGPDLEKLKNFAEKCKFKNINFNGRFSSDNLNEIYEQIDVVWASYPNDDKNVKYAISNKFFESIAFAVPGIFSENTLISKKIKYENIGYLVDPYNIEDIKLKISEIKNNYEEIKNNLSKIVENKFWEEEEEEIKKIFNK